MRAAAKATVRQALMTPHDSQAAQRELRHRNMDMLMSLLLTFEADVFTRWKDAQRTVLESDEWASDAHLSTMDAADMIIVFDEHMRALEKEKETEAAAALKKRRRDERRRREQYKQRLQELVADGTLTARTPWPTIYKLVKHDADFAELAAQPGSSPLDLYFDVVDELESRLHARTKHVERLLESAGTEAAHIDEKTEFEDFKLRLKKASEQDGEGAEVLKDEKELRLVFDEVSAGC
jgi:pre-mRNA-processing factor 40